MYSQHGLSCPAEMYTPQFRDWFTERPRKVLSGLTFVLGGAASGKSAWAEKLIESKRLNAVYVATGQAFDDETKNKIEIHRARRDARWRTVEAPLEIGSALATAAPNEPVLIDCATMWLSNHLLQGGDLDQAQEDLITDLRTCTSSIVIVSNEVGQGIVPENALARQFREAQGRLNIALAAEADLVVQVIAGLPQVLKGTLP